MAAPASDPVAGALGLRRRLRRAMRSARLQLALLLTLAVLPIGIIVLMQSRDAAGHAREMSQRVLLGEAIRVAAAQRAVIRTVQGQARALVPLLRVSAGTTEACSALMEQVVQAAEGIAFSGFATADGALHCTSDRQKRDLSHIPALIAGNGETGVETGAALGPLPGTLLVVQPVYGVVTTEAGVASQRVRVGTVFLGLPQRALLTSDAIPGAEPGALDLATFNRAGELLWASPAAPGTIVGSAEEAAAERLPNRAAREGLVDLPAHGLVARSGAGDWRSYASVPVIEGEIVTLASWQPGSLFDEPQGGQFALSVLLPLLMWALSLLVAYVAVNRLILRPLGALRQRMQSFTSGDRMLPPFRLEGAPDELTDLADTFDAMTSRIVNDETRLETAVHEQKVLLKEVHHRVKNNLQLIASILNMQIRQHRTPENRAVLKRVQDRVMSLATVHQHLYRTPALSALRVDALLREIVNRKLAEASEVAREISTDTEFDDVRLYPDQAVPLALLVGEAVTNVFHHIGRPDGATRPWMRVALRAGKDADVVLEVSNSGGERLTEAQAAFRAGLGTRLIEAFAQQLDGTVTREDGDADAPWVLRVAFPAKGFEEGRTAADPVSGETPPVAEELDPAVLLGRG
ncbi:MAG: histidine kinase dimerization/phosphoacceptor domain -containing protein [Pseudomonadota bacterium]